MQVRLMGYMMQPTGVMSFSNHGKLLEIKAMQACLNKKRRSEESVKYTTWRFSRAYPEGEVPEIIG